MCAGQAAGDRAAGGQPGQRWLTFGALAEAIRAHGAAESGGRGNPPPAARASRPRVVGIDGMSGAGKSEFALRLARELEAPVLSTDDLVPGWDGLAESIRLLIDWVLRPLAEGRPASWRRYDWLAGEPGKWVDLDPGDYLVVEGCCAGLPQAASYLSYLVWIDAPADERRRRLIRRADWSAYAPHADSWARQEKELQSGALTPERANLIVDNSKKRRGGGWTAEGFTGRER
jgi:uridine kinase